MVYFRIVHLTLRNQSKNNCEEQAVEIVLGPKRAFSNGNTGSLCRRKREGSGVSAIPSLRGS